MANTKSARKRAEKSEQQKAANRTARSRMRTAVKKARQAVAAGSEDAQKAVSEAISIVDVSAGKGIVHRNTAARTKSRLAAAARKSAK